MAKLVDKWYRSNMNYKVRRLLSALAKQLSNVAEDDRRLMNKIKASKVKREVVGFGRLRVYPSEIASTKGHQDSARSAKNIVMSRNTREEVLNTGS